MKVLLISPPGRERYVRDYYCSKVAKADYSYSPVDLLMLSGRFDQVAFIDAVQEKLSEDACLSRVFAEAPEAIISLVAAVSWQEDRRFLSRIKKISPGMKIIVTGDVVLEDGERILSDEPWLDGILLDFTNADAVHYLDGRFERITQMIYREEGGAPIVQVEPRKSGSINDLPLPRHELFLNQGYAYPFVRHKSFATVQTDYGCPFPCRFCVMGSLSHRTRPLDDIIAELTCLKKAGIKEVYFNDQTFGGTPKRLEKICQAMLQADLGLGWCCWNRVDVVADQLQLMKDAGCHTIMFGVDSANDATLKATRKGYTVEQVVETFRSCREAGLRTLGTFLIGVPGEDTVMASRTLELALEIDPDYVSFNVYVPRKGSSLRAEMIQSGELFDDDVVLDQSGATVNISMSEILPEELKKLRDDAVRRYYLRPKYIWRSLVRIRTWYDFEVLVRTALSMVW